MPWFFRFYFVGKLDKSKFPIAPEACIGPAVPQDLVRHDGKAHTAHDKKGLGRLAKRVDDVSKLVEKGVAG
jgi:hypothetical protein